MTAGDVILFAGGVACTICFAMIDRLWPRRPVWVDHGIIAFGLALLAMSFMGLVVSVVVPNADRLVIRVIVVGTPAVTVLFWLAFVFIDFMRTAVVEIAAPFQHATVERQITVSGIVKPPNTPVQVFVLSNDHRWYPHQAEVRDRQWSVRCTIGAPEAHGSTYQIAAVAGAAPVTAAAPALPSHRGVSSSVTVRRQ